MRSVGGSDQPELSERGAYLGGDMFFTLQKNWIVGPYNELTGGAGLARRLRSEGALRDRLAVRKATIGRRENEELPVGKRTIYGFRRQIEGMLARQLVLPAGQTPRIIQLFDQEDEFYGDATLEAHHVVEKSMLGLLKLNQNELANSVAPCILIVRGLHEFFTKELTELREQVSSASSQKAGLELMHDRYGELYSGDVLAPMREIAHEVINYAREQITSNP
jgi:hypothetical protein